MFFEPDQFEWTPHLEAAFPLIRAEFDQLKAEDALPWPETFLYNQNWEVFGLYAFGRKMKGNCQKCPQTVAALEAIPGLKTAGFSILHPGTRIQPHVGYSDQVLRCHLGIHVPKDCCLQVAGITKTWQEGKLLIFDDTFEHSAWNGGDRNRIVLLLDFLKPECIKNEVTTA
ncbi:MAG: aspartyl/asparaginyl beta-hydroxylase domain-containing protein [Acidobacteria bacterium]|nr:aspartyl/asparaginyl beta-hydroxylase domain-containing protein [Acidobacteriota bacterium]MCB9396707.1 aspartyl/asparaginyl beta-hydroxylase domain-containing protein [Acidobacteriota bacterium]